MARMVSHRVLKLGLIEGGHNTFLTHNVIAWRIINCVKNRRENINRI